MTADQLVLIFSGSGFVFFLFIHLLTGRLVATHTVFAWFKTTILTSISVQLIGWSMFLFTQPAHLTMVEALIAVGMSVLLQILFIYFYILYVFGPNQTSIRVKLLSVIKESESESLSKDDIISAYGSHQIIQLRLRRLIRNRDIVFQQNKYILKKRTHFFFWLDLSVKVLERLIKPVDQ